jgi:hypothetical protein
MLHSIHITPRDGNPSEITKFQKNMMIALRPGDPEFSVGEFIGQELSIYPRTPKRFATIVPISCI